MGSLHVEILLVIHTAMPSRWLDKGTRHSEIPAERPMLGVTTFGGNLKIRRDGPSEQPAVPLGLQSREGYILQPRARGGVLPSPEAGRGGGSPWRGRRWPSPSQRICRCQAPSSPDTSPSVLSELVSLRVSPGPACSGV